ncbi:hypothetical protein [Tautonia marina]|uniref:hypothetical protein n=1 Tax=Tautonia marina TaxID=2653855 RepID=UPI001260F2B1|nr:hypothetical protein [Tautonia marina]
MTRIARSLTALALTTMALVAPLVPSVRALDEPVVESPRPVEPTPIDIAQPGPGNTLADQIRAFRASKFREIDQAVFELRELIAERSQQLARLETDLREAQQELQALERLAALRSLDASESFAPDAVIDPVSAPLPEPAPVVPSDAIPLPGTFDVVVPTSASADEPGWQGVVRIVSANGGRLDLLHESADGSGMVQAGALQADVIEIRVRSEQEARIIAQALKADNNTVVSWPNLRILADPITVPEPIEQLESTIQRLADAVDRLESRATPSPERTAPAPVIVVKPPDEIPPAPSIPD